MKTTRLWARQGAGCLVCATMLVGGGAVKADAEPLTRVRIPAADPVALGAELETAGFDVLSGTFAGASVDVIVSRPEMKWLAERGLVLEVIARGRPLNEILETDGVPSGYSDLAAVTQQMQDAAANFPDICQFVDLTTRYGTPPTFEGRHMFAVKISDNVTADEDEPKIQIVSEHHAREIVTPVIALHAIEQLTTGYGANPDITAAVDDNEIWIAANWNPDGYNWVFNGDNFWRKNRRVMPGGIGVDQNRNYPFGWFNGCSGSTNPSSGTYKGASPASEPETQTLIAWSDDRHFAKVIDYHSSGRESLWSYVCWNHPFDTWLQSEAFDISDASGYGGDNRRPSADGEHQQWHVGAQGAHAFLIETATQFQPSFTAAEAEAALVFPGILWMIQRPIPLSGHVTDSVTGDPVAASVDLLNVSFPNGETNQSGGPFGRYHVWAPPGQYSVEFSAPDYDPQTHVVSLTASPQVLEIQLVSQIVCPADINGDSVVDVLDLLDLLAAWGPCPGGCPQDINGDESVDVLDLLELLSAWGPCQ